MQQFQQEMYKGSDPTLKQAYIDSVLATIRTLKKQNYSQRSSRNNYSQCPSALLDYQQSKLPSVTRDQRRYSSQIRGSLRNKVPESLFQNIDSIINQKQQTLFKNSVLNLSLKRKPKVQPKQLVLRPWSRSNSISDDSISFIQ